MKRLLLLYLLLLLSGTYLLAQEATTTAIGNAVGSGGTVSYTIGQVAYTSSASANGSVTAGVQQSYLISVTGLERVKGIDLVAYPNPTTDVLTLLVENDHHKNLSYFLYNMNGVLVESRKMINNHTSIEVNRLTSGTYFLKVTDHQQEVKTFQIIKK